MPSAVTAIPISFSRRDLRSTATAAHGSLLVYPPNKKAKQRVAVGDRTGLLSVFSVGKRLEEVHVFSTAESDQASAGTTQPQKPPVSCAALYQDQLFCIRGSVLDAYSRKGKHFFSVDTNATEKIHSLSVHTPFFFIAGEFMLTAFNEGKELGFFMAPDRIQEMVTLRMPSAQSKPEPQLGDFLSCLACSDRTLRLVQENKLVDEIACEAALTTLYYDEAHQQLFYGTQVGSIGIFDVTGEQRLRRRCTFFPQRQLQAVPPPEGGLSWGSSKEGASGEGRNSVAGEGTNAALTCISVYDINLDGKQEVLAGYENGTVQVFATVGADGSGGPGSASGPGSRAAPYELQAIWCGNVGERVQSIAAGAVTQSSEQPDVLVHVFSGQVIAFTLQFEDAERHNAAGIDTADAAKRHQEQREAVAAKKADTEKEIAALQEAVAAKVRLLAAMTGAAAKQAPVVAVASTFTANVGLRTVDRSAMLSLTIDADVPLECAIVRSTAAEIAFFGTEFTHVATRHRWADGSAPAGARSRRASSVSSLSPTASPTAAAAAAASTGTHTKSLALATPQQQQESGNAGKRLEVLLWADEGHADVLSVTLYATPAPRTAQVKTVLLCALPLYRRIGTLACHFDSELEMAVALSSLTMRGSFSLRQVADWLSRLLPDMPENAATQQLQESAASGKQLAFFSAFLGTVLSVEYTSGGEAEEDAASVVFTSDSLTTLSTVKKHVVRQASMAAVGFRMKEQIQFGSAVRKLALLHPMMARCAEATKQAQILEGLRELQSSDADLSYFPVAHQKLIQNAEAVLAEAAKQRQHESYLKRSVVALYNCLVEFREHAPRCTPQLQEDLEDACCGTRYSSERLSKIFFPNGEDEAERREVLDRLAATAQSYAASAPQASPGGQPGLDNSGSSMEVLSSPSLSGGEEV